VEKFKQLSISFITSEVLASWGTERGTVGIPSKMFPGFRGRQLTFTTLHFRSLSHPPPRKAGWPLLKASDI
jgi:hypothetical protein